MYVIMVKEVLFFGCVFIIVFGDDGLLYVSEIVYEYIENVFDVYSVGD